MIEKLLASYGETERDATRMNAPKSVHWHQFCWRRMLILGLLLFDFM